VTIVRIGATQTYSDNWEKAFGKTKAVKTGAGSRAKSNKKAPGKKPAKKAAKRR